MSSRLRSMVLIAALAAPLAAGARLDAGSALFESLKAFGSRLKAGDPGVASTWEGGKEGPKGIAAGDLDGDGDPDIAVSNLDGTVTVFLNEGKGGFGPPIHLPTGSRTLREIIIADLTGEGAPDIAACALDGSVVVFPNCRGPGKAVLSHDPALRIPTWTNARNLAAGDFDGSGKPSLAVAGSGVGLRTYKWSAGGFRQVADLFGDLPDLAEEFSAKGGDSKPVFSLRSFRPKGAPRDQLAMTHAWAGGVLVLSAGAAGRLESWGFVGGTYGIYDLDVGPLLAPASGPPDLLTVHRDAGIIQVLPGRGEPLPFDGEPGMVLDVPGGPRAARIIDLDGDGWNDLVVAVRDYDVVLTFRNRGGTLVPGSEMPVGRSPRDLAAADYNRDGRPDVAVINRESEDLSILTAYLGEAGFASLDHLYLVDGEAADLALRDLDLDGRDDVIQLHRASGEVSVRRAGEAGVLSYARYYPMGSLPAALRTADVNGDASPDVLTANLGLEGVEAGSVSVRLGDGTGDLGRERRFGLPSEGRIYSLEDADLDGDGDPDLAAGFLDYRIGFFKNLGGSSGCGTWGEPGCGLVFTGAYGFVREEGGEITSATAIRVAAGDFDRDGDLDIAAAGWAGDLAVLENRGELLQGSTGFVSKIYPPPRELYGIGDLEVRDLDGDGDLDLILTGRDRILTYRGAAGMDFVPSPLPGSDLIRSARVAVGDFDGDGDQDIALAGRVFSVVTILTQGEGGFAPALTIDVPAGRLIAAGDIDGDGSPDLAGSGDALWTALSGSRPLEAAPLVPEGDGRRIEGLVINEFLASNQSFPIPPDGKSSEWLEVYNGSREGLDLQGYRLALTRKDPPDPPEEYRFDSPLVLASGGYLLLICNRTLEPLHTGFKLPMEGGVLTLLDPRGSEVDRVEYPPQRTDVSFGRYQDGFPSFAFKEIPSPGSANLRYAPTRATIRLQAVVPDGWTFDEPVRNPLPGKPVRFFARGRDDVGIVSVRLFYGSRDTPGSRFQWIYLHDDGLHGDGGLRDGLFSGVLPGGFPSGGGGCIAVEIDPLDGEEETDPEDPDPGEIGEGRGSYCVELEPEVELEIMEIVSSNIHGLMDESLGHPDWVEVQNPSAAGVPLKDLYLGERFPADRNWFPFPEGKTLAPGERLVIYCDGRPGQGDLHTPFELNAEEGGQLVLVSGDPLGPRTAYTLIQAVKYPPLPSDVAWASMRSGWDRAVPTPGKENSRGAARLGDVDMSGVLELSDGIQILNFLFLGQGLECLEAADFVRDSQVDITDVIGILRYLYMGGESPPVMPVNCS